MYVQIMRKKKKSFIELNKILPDIRSITVHREVGGTWEQTSLETGLWKGEYGLCGAPLRFGNGISPPVDFEP